MKLREIPGRTVGLILILSSLLIGITLIVCDLRDDASHTMHPNAPTADASNAMRGTDPTTVPHGPPPELQIDPAHEWQPPVAVWSAGPQTLSVRIMVNGGVALVIRPDGVVKWKNHEITGDAEFRRAMRDVATYITRGCAQPPINTNGSAHEYPEPPR